MKLIDADALAKFIDYGHLNNPNEKLYSENDIREMIDMMPTVDAVPVVRCRECRFRDRFGFCRRWLWQKAPKMEDDEYCSGAERKEE